MYSDMSTSTDPARAGTASRSPSGGHRTGRSLAVAQFGAENGALRMAIQLLGGANVLIRSRSVRPIDYAPLWDWVAFIPTVVRREQADNLGQLVILKKLHTATPF
jgi:hypothetical protein